LEARCRDVIRVAPHHIKQLDVAEWHHGTHYIDIASCQKLLSLDLSAEQCCSGLGWIAQQSILQK